MFYLTLVRFWFHNTYIGHFTLINIGSGNDLVPSDTKPLSAPMLVSLVGAFGIHLQAVLQKVGQTITRTNIDHYPWHRPDDITCLNDLTFSHFFAQDYHGKGDCDGQFEKHRHFQTQPLSALFVAINKVRQCPDPTAYTDWKSCLSSSHEYQDDREHPPLGIGERVVWLSDGGPEHGSVKWIGFLHDTRDKEWTVGVEFVSIIFSLPYCYLCCCCCSFHAFYSIYVWLS